MSGKTTIFPSKSVIEKSFNSQKLLLNDSDLNESSSEKKIPLKYWNKQEDTLLLNLYEEFGNKWIEISKRLDNRTPAQCIQRWRRLFRPNKVRKNWTKKEDSKLLELVQSHGQKWRTIGSFLNKTGKQVRERYINHLDPSINRKPFSKEEDQLIMQYYQIHGSKWNFIAKKLGNRPENTIKNRFYSALKKQLLEKENSSEKIFEESYQDNHLKIKENKNSNVNTFFNSEEGENSQSYSSNDIEDLSQENMEFLETKKANEPLGTLQEDDFLNKYIDFGGP